MRAKGAAIQGGLAALGLIAAYTTWQREPERAPGEVVLLDANKSDLNKIRYENDKKWVEMELRKDPDGSPVVWLHVAATDTPKAPERELRGNEGALRLWDKFAPLKAARALGQLDAAKLKELGLDAPKKRIEVTAKGQKHVYVAGQPSFNVSEPYLQDDGDKRVYVLGGGILQDLDSTTVRLIDRQLHSFKTTEFDELTVSAGGKKREMVQEGAPLPGSAKMASKKTPGKPDELARNWHDKVWRLYASEVLGKGEAPAAGNPEVSLRIDYVSKGKPKGFIEVGHTTAAPTNAPTATSSPPAPPTTDYWARTEHTAGWVKLPASAEDVLRETDKIASGE
jgi:hypothetical protein